MENTDSAVAEFDGWLRDLMEGQGSDLHVKVGSPPMIRLPDGLKRMDRDPITPVETSAIAESIIPADRKETFDKNGEVDFAYSLQGGGSLPRERLQAARLDLDGAPPSPVRRTRRSRRWGCRTPCGSSPTSIAA